MEVESISSSGLAAAIGEICVGLLLVAIDDTTVHSLDSEEVTHRIAGRFASHSAFISGSGAALMVALLSTGR